MKELSILEYPDALLCSLQSFLKNPLLLNVFVQIIFNKTNCFDTQTLCSTMTLVKTWICQLEDSGLQFPTNFNFHFYFKGVERAAKLEHSISVPRTLWCIYYTMHYYPVEQRNTIVLFILKDYFYETFFSWSFNIRDIFQLIFLFQIYHGYVVRGNILENIEQSKLKSERLTTLPNEENKKTSDDLSIYRVK